MHLDRLGFGNPWDKRSSPCHNRQSVSKIGLLHNVLQCPKSMKLSSSTAVAVCTVVVVAVACQQQKSSQAFPPFPEFPLM